MNTGLKKKENEEATPIHLLKIAEGNQFYIKREDMLPFSFGGNKARKGFLFLNEIDSYNAGCIVTYGSSSSNHGRIIANIASMRNVPCYLVSPEETRDATSNSRLFKLLRAEVIYCSIKNAGRVIEETVARLRGESLRPYFIMGGGHGNIGTQAYVQCYQEILEYERKKGLHFDYIFHASGTGTTQAGLICGSLIEGDGRKIVGISIARTKERGIPVIYESIKEYLSAHGYCHLPLDGLKINFVDDFVYGGYGKYNAGILKTVQKVMLHEGVPLDTTYTGKACYGMERYVESHGIKRKNILFIHTGGTPLFFDRLNELSNMESLGWL